MSVKVCPCTCLDSLYVWISLTVTEYFCTDLSIHILMNSCLCASLWMCLVCYRYVYCMCFCITLFLSVLLLFMSYRLFSDNPPSNHNIYFWAIQINSIMISDHSTFIYMINLTIIRLRSQAIFREIFSLQHLARLCEDSLFCNSLKKNRLTDQLSNW